VFERLTDRARRVLVVAQEEAKDFHHEFIRPEHLLLGLAQGEGLAARALGEVGVTPERLRAQVGATIERSKADRVGPKLPFSPDAKKALENSFRQALRLGHNYIGTEHLLLGVFQVFKDDTSLRQLLGVDPADVRARLDELIPNGAVADLPQSPAAAGALGLAREMAGSGPMNTGHLLLAVLSDTASQGTRALATLGVTVESLTSQLAEIPLDGTTDAPPRPQIVEIKLGDTTTTIGDPELAAALGGLSPEDLRLALRGAVVDHPRKPESGSEQAS
jgi:ATP-dependent Clp protease ATP-binding subunit ClpC